MLTQALYAVGKAIIGGEPHAEMETDAMKLLARSDVELDVAVGSVILFLIGFALIFGLGFLTESIWQSKLGADAGGGICAVGITGFLLHYARSRILRRLVRRRPGLSDGNRDRRYCSHLHLLTRGRRTCGATQVFATFRRPLWRSLIPRSRIGTGSLPAKSPPGAMTSGENGGGREFTWRGSIPYDVLGPFHLIPWAGGS